MKIEVQLTEKAREKMQQLLSDSIHKSFRMLIKAFGWTGIDLELALDELKKGDAEIKSGGISIIYNPKEKLYYHRCVIDYREDLNGGELAITPWFSGFH